jgi:hypothetical protein
MAIKWGSLKPREETLDTVSFRFTEAYDQRRITEKYIGQLPLENRAIRFNIVELTPNKIYIVISYRPFGAPVWLGSEMEAYPLSQFPALKSVGSIDDAIVYLRLGPICDRPKALLVQKSDEDAGVYQARVGRWATRWGTSVAKSDIARTHPDFVQAQNRMTEAYSKLFELETHLRAFIQQILENRYGSKWWAKVFPETRKQVEAREADATNKWFDDYTPSRLKFAEFDGLRRTILKNWGDFEPALGDRELFHAQMVYLSRARNRIAHVNTLSGDDFQEFLMQSQRVLKIVRTHVQLP